MGNCGNSSSTEAQAPAGPITLLSHYMLSPSEKKDVHTGIQVLSTRHCGTTGVGTKEHYVQNLSHVTALNYLYIYTWRMWVYIHTCMSSVASSCVLCWMLTCFFHIWLDLTAKTPSDPGAIWSEGRTYGAHAYSSVYGLHTQTYTVYHPKHIHTAETHSAFLRPPNVWYMYIFPIVGSHFQWRGMVAWDIFINDLYNTLKSSAHHLFDSCFHQFSLVCSYWSGLYFGSISVDISFSQLNISSLRSNKSLSLYYKLMRLALPHLLRQIYWTIILPTDHRQLCETKIRHSQLSPKPFIKAVVKILLLYWIHGLSDSCLHTKWTKCYMVGNV